MKTFQELIASPVLVLVYFKAVWCTHCEAMSSVLAKIKAEQKDDICLIEVDADKYTEIALKYSIQTLPTLLFFKEGRQIWRQSGMIGAAELTQVVKMFK